MSGEPQLTGQVLDETYRIEKLLGQGGMGTVYLATHIGTGRPVAVKVIFPHFMANEQFVERFRREARAAGLLRHPNIVDVTDFGFSESGPDSLAYLVMEYLDGVSLKEVLKEERDLPLSWVVDIIEQVCVGIDRAHSQGIVHRDLKPENIWLEPNDRGGYTVKILDFGVAHLVPPRPAILEEDCETLIAFPNRGAEAPQTSGPDKVAGAAGAATAAARLTGVRQNAAEPTDSGITEAGAVLGTPRYMSPEQCLGKTVDTRSDVYSIGVITYEMLAGEPPFTGDLHTLISQHVDGVPVSLASKQPDVPEAVSEIVMATLAKAPSNRPQSAMAFSSALRARTEGVGFLFRQALALYSEHFSTFARIGLIAVLPLIALSPLELLGLIPAYRDSAASTVISLVYPLVGYLAAQLISTAVFVPVVAQLLIAPLRPVRLGPAFGAVRKRLRPFFFASLRFTMHGAIAQTCILIAIGAAVWILMNNEHTAVFFMKDYSTDYRLEPSITVFAAAVMALVLVEAVISFRALLYSFLYGPIVMMEGLRGKALRDRSKELVNRSRQAVAKVFLTCALPFLVPALVVPLWQIRTGEAPAVHLRASSAVVSFLLDLALYGVYILIIPLFAMTLALLYFKLRRMQGTTIRAVLAPYEREFMRGSDWRSRGHDDLHIQIHSRR